MICHQKLVKEKTRQEDLEKYGPEIFDTPIRDYVFDMVPIKGNKEVKNFVIRYEWLGNLGIAPKWVFTARTPSGVLACVVCFNEPNSYSKILGDDTRRMEALIQRGASASFAHPHLGSRLIRWACRWMVKNTNKRIFYGYSDPLGGEIGTVYQACGFDYLGSDFGATKMYKHPDFKNGQPFSSQSLRRTTVWKKMYKIWHGKELPKEFLSSNGFKNMAIVDKLDPLAKREFYDWGNKIIRESEEIKIPSKGKYVLVLGYDRLEQEFLNSKKTYKTKPYPKRV